LAQVNDVKLISDRVTHKFKGIGYIELEELSMVAPAINLSGQLLRGKFPIMIKSSEAEKNFAAERAWVLFLLLC
jgi:RNA-binding protein 39